MNTTGERVVFRHIHSETFPFLAFSLAASMFDNSSVENGNLSDTNTELYILGIKYTTPNGE
jgi:hypothetical protein